MNSFPGFTESGPDLSKFPGVDIAASRASPSLSVSQFLDLMFLEQEGSSCPKPQSEGLLEK